MAKNEGQFQSELMKDLREILGAKVDKISNTIGVMGIPDLDLISKEFGPMKLELKFESAPKMPSTLLKVDLSVHQRRYLKDYNNTSGDGPRAGWVLCVKYSDSEWRAYAGVDHEVDRITQDSFVCIRNRGQKWNVRSILEAIRSPSISSLNQVSLNSI